jgi:hypothetical protein
MENRPQNIELSEILAAHAETFLGSSNLCSTQRKSYQALMKCRTSSMGGHVSQCDQCGHKQIAYNSCRDRHCPKCQYIKKIQWVDRVAATLPPVRHFHIVFTIPQSLRTLFYINQDTAYNLLFKAAGQTLLQTAQNPDYLGARAGAVAILHTWTQTLLHHPHIHMIVPAGGLSEDMMEWIPSRKKFFAPVKAMSRQFRGILMRLIADALNKKQIKLPDNETFEALKKRCYATNWVVYCQRPFSDSESLIGYLGNYTHRVAISNSRITSYDGEKVQFRYKDNKKGGINRTMTLKAEEFVARFMQHILPKGFYKVRYFGFLALCNLSTQLQTCYELIGKETWYPVLQGLPALEVLRHVTGVDPLCCPVCQQGRMRITAAIRTKEKAG